MEYQTKGTTAEQIRVLRRERKHFGLTGIREASWQKGDLWFLKSHTFLKVSVIGIFLWSRTLSQIFNTFTTNNNVRLLGMSLLSS